MIVKYVLIPKFKLSGQRALEKRILFNIIEIGFYAVKQQRKYNNKERYKYENARKSNGCFCRRITG